MGDGGTSGGCDGTGGGRPVGLWSALIATVPAITLAQVSINAVSRLADSAALGRPMPPALAWGYELTSGAAILLLLPAIWWAAGRLTPARLGWAAAVAAQIGASLAFSILHVALMTGARLAIWRGAYDAGPQLQAFLYEYRKDALTYALIALVLGLARAMRAQDGARATAGAVAARPMLVVQDGARRVHVPIDEIDRVAAAGNYVELGWGGRTLLHRATLAAVAAELGDGFVRIHRGRIVRRDAIRAVETNQAGDFEVVLADGVRAKGSRRYRGAIDARRL